MKPLQNKIAIITGGSRGMGATTAKQLAADGAEVIITYAKSAKEAEDVVGSIVEAGGKARAVQADARDPAKLHATLAKLGQEVGHFDILINNAGVFLDSAMAEPSAWENFQTMMNINVLSVFAGTQALLPFLRDGGRIINIGSVMGQAAMFPNYSGYAASKSAVAGLASGWVRDLGPRQITVNTIEPGPIDTEMNPANSEMAGFLTQQVPQGRYGKPEEIASLAAFLASPAAAYINGARISIGGGIGA